MKFLQGKASKDECRKITQTLSNINDFFDVIKLESKKAFSKHFNQRNTDPYNIYYSDNLFSQREIEDLQIMIITRII
jgi:nicotinic acid phosphoribosyltransferase